MAFKKANGPKLWAEVLSHFPPGAVVAGGCIRDYLLREPAKDIDVFMNCTDWPQGCFPGFAPLGEDRNEEYAAMPTIAVVARGVIGGRQIDAVGVILEGDALDGAELMNTFDFAISRCWFDGEIHDTPEAAKDRADGTVTLLLGDRIERSRRRFERFNARNGGGFTLIEAFPAPTLISEDLF